MDAGFDGGFDAGHAVDDAGFDAGREDDDAGYDAGEDDAGYDGGDRDAGFDAGEPDPVCEDRSDAPEIEPVPDVLITTLADLVDANDGVLSLREALNQLQSGAIPPGSVIGFDPSLSGTVELSSPLDVRKSVTLVGHDANADGEPDIWLELNSTTALLRFYSPTTAIFRVRWLGFTGSSYLLGLHQEDGDTELHVEHCAFADTTAGGGAAILADGDSFAAESANAIHMSIRHSTFRNVHRVVSFLQTVSENHITVLIESSVFENAAINPHAIWLRNIAQATLVNTIITGPTSAAAINLRSVQDARLVNTTVATSSAAPRLLHRASSVRLHNSVLTGQGADCAIDSTSDPVTAHHSFIGATDGCTFTGDGNITGTLASPADPQLLAFDNYGGARKSAPPAPGSPLIDSGDDTRAVYRDGAPILDDVRGLGFPRRCDGDGDGVATVDIGATEFKPAE